MRAPGAPAGRRAFRTPGHRPRRRPTSALRPSVPFRPYATVAHEVTRSRRKMSGGSLARGFLFRLFRPEQLAHLGEERLRLRVRVLAGEGGELLEQLTLLLGQLLRHLDGHTDVLIAALVAVEVRDALSAQPEHLAALRAGRDLHLHLPVERRHVDGRAQRRLGEADGDLADDLGILADEAGVFLDVHDHVQVSRRAAPLPRLTLAGELEPGPGIDPRRHLHGEHAFGLDLARPAASHARVGDDLTGSLALAAGPGDLEEPLRHPQLAGSVAGGTGLRSGPRPGARPVADGAFLVAGKLDPPPRAAGRPREKHPHAVAGGRSPPARGARPP